MIDAFTTVRRAADRYTHEYVLDDVDDRELLAWGEAGLVVLIARCEARIRQAVARSSGSGTAERDDMLQTAMEAFVAAMTEYDPDGPADPYTFAHYRIVQAVKDASMEQSIMSIPPRSQRRFWQAMSAADHNPVRARRWSALQRLTGWALQELADAGDVVAASILDERIALWERKGHDIQERMSDTGRGLEPHVFDALHAALFYVSVDEAVPTDTDGETLTYGDTIADEAAEAAITSVEGLVATSAMLSTLDDRERRTLVMLYGLDGHGERTASDVAEVLGVSRPRVQNIKAAALRKLRKAVDA